MPARSCSSPSCCRWPCRRARARTGGRQGRREHVKVGTLVQSWAEVSQNPARDDYAKNIFLRRARIILGGTIGKQFGFFLDTDVPNLGKSSAGAGTTSQAVILQDGWFEWKPNDDVDRDGRTVLRAPVPPLRAGGSGTPRPRLRRIRSCRTRPCRATTAATAASRSRAMPPERSSRYRVAVLQGLRDQRATNGFRVAGRAQYSFWEADVTPFYTGHRPGQEEAARCRRWRQSPGRLQRVLPSTCSSTVPRAPARNHGAGQRHHVPRRWRLPGDGPRADDVDGRNGLPHRVSCSRSLRVEGQRFANDLAALNDQTRGFQPGWRLYLRGANANLKAASPGASTTRRRVTCTVTVQFQVFL